MAALQPALYACINHPFTSRVLTSLHACHPLCYSTLQGVWSHNLRPVGLQLLLFNFSPNGNKVWRQKQGSQFGQRNQMATTAIKSSSLFTFEGCAALQERR